MSLAESLVLVLTGLGGVFLGWGLRRRDQMRQEDREDSYRWHGDRMKAYTGYLGAVYRANFQWTAVGSMPNLSGQVAAVWASSESWLEAKAEVDLLADTEVLEAADALADALADVVNHASSRDVKRGLRWRSPSEDQGLEETRQTFQKSRTAFLRAVRDELGLER